VNTLAQKVVATEAVPEENPKPKARRSPLKTGKDRTPFEILDEFIELVHRKTVYEDVIRHLNTYVSHEVGRPKILECRVAKLEPRVSEHSIMDVMEEIQRSLAATEERLQQLGMPKTKSV
jgi:hypothetical protein